MKVARTRFFLNISSHDCKKIYRGTVKSVVVKATNGQTLQFPVEELMPFITEGGIYGWFEVVFDERDKLLSFKKNK